MLACTTGGRKMKKVSVVTVVLYGLCAMMWTVRAILEIVYRTYQDSAFWFGMNVLCGVIWAAAFIKTFRRYRAQKAEKETYPAKDE